MSHADELQYTIDCQSTVDKYCFIASKLASRHLKTDMDVNLDVTEPEPEAVLWIRYNYDIICGH